VKQLFLLISRARLAEYLLLEGRKNNSRKNCRSRRKRNSTCHVNQPSATRFSGQLQQQAYGRIKIYDVLFPNFVCTTTSTQFDLEQTFTVSELL